MIVLGVALVVANWIGKRVGGANFEIGKVIKGKLNQLEWCVTANA
jgi:hypothetical protein